MRKYRGSLIVAFSALGLVAPAILGAQNLVPNGEFDIDDSDWDPLSADTVTLGRDEADHALCAGSGLATVIASSAGQETYIFNDNISVVAGESYSFGGYVFFPAGQDRTGNAKIWIIWTTGCFSTQGVSQALPIVTTGSAGTWVRTELTAAAPAGANCAHVHVRLIKTEAGGSLAVHVDGVFLDPRDGFLFENGFEDDSLCRWSSAVP